MKFSIYILLILSISALALRSKSLKKKKIDPQHLNLEFITVLLPRTQEPIKMPFKSITPPLTSSLSSLGYSFQLDLKELQKDKKVNSDKVDEILTKYFVKDQGSNYILPFYYIRAIKEKYDTKVYEYEYLCIDVSHFEKMGRAVFKIYFKYGEGKKSRDALYDLLLQKKSKVDLEMAAYKQKMETLYSEYEKGKSFRKELRTKTLNKEEAILKHNETINNLKKQGQEMQKSIEQIEIEISNLENKLNLEKSNFNSLLTEIQKEENEIEVLEGKVDTSKYNIRSSKQSKKEIINDIKSIIKGMAKYLPQEKIKFWTDLIPEKKPSIEAVTLEVSII